MSRRRSLRTRFAAVVGAAAVLAGVLVTPTPATATSSWNARTVLGSPAVDFDFAPNGTLAVGTSAGLKLLDTSYAVTTTVPVSSFPNNTLNNSAANVLASKLTTNTFFMGSGRSNAAGTAVMSASGTGSATVTALGTLSSVAGPYGLASSPSEATLYAFTYDNHIVEVDVGTNTVTDRGAFNPRAAAYTNPEVSANGAHIYFVSDATSYWGIYDYNTSAHTATAVLTTTARPSLNLALDPSGAYLYAAAANVMYKIPLANPSAATSLTLTGAVGGFALSSDGQHLWAIVANGTSAPNAVKLRSDLSSASPLDTVTTTLTSGQRANSLMAFAPGDASVAVMTYFAGWIWTITGANDPIPPAPTTSAPTPTPTTSAPTPTSSTDSSAASLAATGVELWPAAVAVVLLGAAAVLLRPRRRTR